MTDDLSFWVPGIPAPQGSKKHVGGGRMVESSKKVKPWRKAVHEAARAAQPAGFRAFDGPVAVTYEFWMPRPTTYPKTWRVLPHKTPDLDKLLRSTNDALTSSGTIQDDGRIVIITSTEEYVPSDPRHARDGDAATSGVLITIAAVDAVAEPARTLARTWWRAPRQPE